MGYNILFAVFSLLLIIVDAQRFPTISYISQEKIIDIGGSIELECSVQYVRDFPVLWMKVDTVDPARTIPLSSGSNLIVKDSRFSLRYDQSSSTYTLQIKDIQENDQGKYQCQVLLTVTEKISADVSVSVRIPPIIFDNSTRSVIVSEGEGVKLECYAGGYPAPIVSWRRENYAVLPTGGSQYRGNILQIPSVTKDDRGTYYCVAENGVGKGKRRNIAVEVEFAPVITVPRPRLGQALQYDMDLECHVIAYPPPAITWWKDDIQLSNNQHYSISHFATADEFTDTTLRILTVEKRQYGKYSCRAANKLGTVDANVELFETVIPICPPACGQNYFSINAAVALNQVDVALPVLILICMFRNWRLY